jgi:Mg-chelatase subunit ChlI
MWLLENEIKERWQVLCEQAATEQDPEKFLAVIKELTAELDRRSQRKKLPPSNGEGHNTDLP